MKFQVVQEPWCIVENLKWTIYPLGDQTWVKIGTVEEFGTKIMAYVEADLPPSLGDEPYSQEWIVAEGLYRGMKLITDYIKTKQPQWRKDFGQI